MRILLLLMALTLLAGCSYFKKPELDRATLETYEPAVRPLSYDQTPPNISRDDVIRAYQSLLLVSKDPVVRETVLRRLADLQMLVSEDRQVESDSSSVNNAVYYEDAVKAYEALLTAFPDRENNDHLLYQLAKAKSLSGDPKDSLQYLDRLVAQYPKSVYFIEAQFRRGERLFVLRRYGEAELAYQTVATQGQHSKYYINSLYMWGWSLFKQSRLDEGLKVFDQAVNLMLPQGQSPDDLTRAQKELLDDTLRVMALSFSYMEGPATIAWLYDPLPEPRHYEYLVYQRLGDLYVEKERYTDAINTYKSFVERRPLNARAPEFQLRIIDGYAKAALPTKILPEKELFVRSYGIRSEFWKVHNQAVRDRVKPHLKSFLDELAKYYHAIAQEKKKPEDYQLAARWYSEYIDTFPDDPDAANIWFLLGEVQFEAKDYSAAVEAYENAAYRFPQFAKRAEAGYAAIVAYNAYEATLDEPDKTNWKRLKVDSQLRFASEFPQDPRAIEVQTKAAEILWELKEYREAQMAAEKVVSWQPAPKASLVNTGWTIIGLTAFELEEYAKAENAYMTLLDRLPLDDKRRQGFIENLAASIYRQGEVAEREGKLREAVDQYLRVAAVTPNVELAQSGQFDAATLLLKLEDWQAAVDVLENFRVAYPNNPLVQEIPLKLVVAYENLGQWDNAADELLQIAANSKDPAIKQEAWIKAAELYERAGRTEQAINAYAHYANNYPYPFNDQLEAMAKLTQLYAEVGDYSERRLWLQRIIELDDNAGADRTDRSKYLAASASAEFAEEAFEAYEKIQLTLPLKKSFARKKKALTKVLDLYKATAKYGVAEYTTHASYKIAEIYGQLSRDLLNAERPKNLSELALEQYEILLEEQAYPFEEKAIAIHETNIKRTTSGIYDKWVKASFKALANILPARYGKQEKREAYSEAIR